MAKVEAISPIRRQDDFDAAIMKAQERFSLKTKDAWVYIDGYMEGVKQRAEDKLFVNPITAYGVTFRTHDGHVEKIVFETPVQCGQYGHLERRFKNLTGAANVVVHRTPTKKKRNEEENGTKV